MAEFSSAPTSLLAVNGEPSTVKTALVAFAPRPEVLARQVVTTTGAAAVEQVIAWADRQAPSTIAAIGHRIVHGGLLHRAPQRLTAAVREELNRLVPFAPNHLPQELALIDALAARRPGIPQVACFDTAFHRNIPDVARRLPIPAAYDARGVRHRRARGRHPGAHLRGVRLPRRGTRREYRTSATRRSSRLPKAASWSASSRPTKN